MKARIHAVGKYVRSPKDTVSRIHALGQSGGGGTLQTLVSIGIIGEGKLTVWWLRIGRGRGEGGGDRAGG